MGTIYLALYAIFATALLAWEPVVGGVFIFVTGIGLYGLLMWDYNQLRKGK